MKQEPHRHPVDMANHDKGRPQEPTLQIYNTRSIAPGTPLPNLHRSTTSEFVEIIRQTLDTSTQVADVISFPSLLINLPNGESMYGKLPAAELAIGYFRDHGFAADRTRMNLDGYPGLLRKLGEPLPWVKVEPDDVSGPVSEVRAFELRSLMERVNSDDASVLLGERREAEEARKRYASEILGRRISEHSSPFAEEMFAELICLGKSIGCSNFEAVWCAIFDFDEFSIRPGAPDLLVWLLDAEHPLWFFTEVKGPGDSLRKSQKDWISENWSVISGRFIITSLC